MKEFRRGLRGKSFEWTIIALHLGMLLTVASGLTRQQRGGDASFVGGFFWAHGVDFGSLQIHHIIKFKKMFTNIKVMSFDLLLCPFN